MADISPTAANVKVKSNTAQPLLGRVGEAVTQAQPCYLNTDGKYWKADADALATAAATVVALTPAATDGFALFAKAGATIDLGVTLTVGQIYVVSTNPGGIAPYSDLGSGDFVTIIGVPTAADSIQLIMHASPVAKA
jgi:hypothetical protein